MAKLVRRPHVVAGQHGPGYARMMNRLGPKRAEELRQRVLADQATALSEVGKHRPEPTQDRESYEGYPPSQTEEEALMATNEQVPFRLFTMPCCKHQLCWVNPRLPSHCPECGQHVLLQLRTGVYTVMDTPAWLRIE